MVEAADILNILGVYIVPNLNVFLICLSLLMVYLYFKTQVKTAVVKDTSGKEVPVQAKVKLPSMTRFLKFVCSWLGVATILLGLYSAYLGAWTPFFNLMLIVVGVSATANDLYRFPWAALVTSLILVLIYNAGPLTGAEVLYNLQNPYVFGGIGFGSFGVLYLKLKFFGDMLVAGSKGLAKLTLFFALVGIAEGALSLI